MIKALVSNNESQIIVDIEVYFDTTRSDICMNAYYPFLKAKQYDIRHFRYWEKDSNKQIAKTILSFICDIAKEEEDTHIKNKIELTCLLESINYHRIFKKSKKMIYK